MDALNFYFGSLSGPLADKYGRRKMGQVRIVFLTSFLVEVCCFFNLLLRQVFCVICAINCFLKVTFSFAE